MCQIKNCDTLTGQPSGSGLFFDKNGEESKFQERNGSISLPTIFRLSAYFVPLSIRSRLRRGLLRLQIQQFILFREDKNHGGGMLHEDKNHSGGENGSID